MKVSVILPTYNEADNIVELVRQIKRYMPAHCLHEIIVVDDNSPDQTHRIVQTFSTDDPTVIPILRKRDRGLANSIRDGIETASGDQILVMDTDFTHDPAAIPKMLHVAQVYDIVSCSRFCPGGNMQDTKHYFASMVYNWLIRLIIRTQIQDNLGGFFTINRSKLYELPFGKIFLGYGDYFFRFLHYAQKQGFSIVEIPAIYGVRQYGSSKSNFLKLLMSYTLSLIRLKVQIVREG